MAKPKSIALRITAESKGSKATVRIVDYIGGETANSSNMRSMADLLANQGVTDLEVYINSRGGNVFEATEITNELKRFKNVTVRVGALAASAATRIISEFYTIGRRTSQFMIHKPMLGTYGNVGQLEADIKLLKNITTDYLEAYAKKMGKTTDEVAALWAEGDHWMTANEALVAKLINEIEEGDEDITDEEVALLEAAGAPVIPTNTLKTKHPKKMERLELIAALGLPADATDAQIAAVVAANRTKAEAYETEKANADALRKIRAEALVNGAILGKKIMATQKEQYEKLAFADYDSVATILGQQATIPQLSAELRGGGTVVEAHANWTIEDYLEKDPQALVKLEKENPEAYEKLEAAY